MSDIFREVDEDIRREQAKKLWDRFAPYVLAGAVLIVVATAGYRGWVYWQETRAAATGDKFQQALQFSTIQAHEQAVILLEEIVADGHGGYPMLARLRLATEKSRLGDRDGAVAEFDAIASSNAPEEMRSLARLRAALLLADWINLADMQQRIGDLAGTGNTWRHTAREILGLVAWRNGDFVAARDYFEEIANDQEAPSDVAERAEMMLQMLAMRLDESGAVVEPIFVTPAPPPPAPAPPAVEPAPAAEPAAPATAPGAPATEPAPQP